MSDNYVPTNNDTSVGLTYIPIDCMECCYSALRERHPGVEPCRSCGTGPGGAR